MTDAQRVEQARQAKLALDNFLSPAFDIIRLEYESRLREICAARPWDTNRIAALANAGRIVDEVQNQIHSIVADGVDAQGNIDRTKRIEALTPAKRRLFNIGQH